MAMVHKSSLTNASNASKGIRCCVILVLCVFGFVINLQRPVLVPYYGGEDGSLSSPPRKTSNNNQDITASSLTLKTAISSIKESTNKKSLAYQQSFGFFDNLDDEDWKIRQRRARSHRHFRSASTKIATKDTQVGNWYLANYYPLFTCPHQTRVGGSGDGPKWVCDPHRLKRASETHPGGEKCLIYSVGCHGNYIFEDSLVNLIGARTCEIHVFDVAENYMRPGDDTKKDIHFHHWGLASSYSNLGRSSKYTYLTLQETMLKLGHVNRTIDIFKIDCEKCEWITYKDWIREDVDIRQILIETHGIPLDMGVQPSTFFDDIQRAGFAMYSKEPNIHPKVGGRCVEWSFVKLHKDFFGATTE